MTFHTPKEAAKFECPVARITPSNKADCQGPKCILWRWKPRLISDLAFVSAIKREVICLAKDYNENRVDGQKEKLPASFQKAATARVCADPEGYGITPERGYCGLGGVPTS